MKKIMNIAIASLLLLMIFITSCQIFVESKESGCASDCGEFKGITKLQCTEAGGDWNECGSPCAGTDAEFCIQVCSPQCECGGIAGFKCPVGYKCRLSGKAIDEIGVCIKE